MTFYFFFTSEAGTVFNLVMELTAAQLIHARRERTHRSGISTIFFRHLNVFLRMFELACADICDCIKWTFISYSFIKWNFNEYCLMWTAENNGNGTGVGFHCLFFLYIFPKWQEVRNCECSCTSCVMASRFILCYNWTCEIFILSRPL